VVTGAGRDALTTKFDRPQRIAQCPPKRITVAIGPEYLWGDETPGLAELMLSGIFQWEIH